MRRKARFFLALACIMPLGGVCAASQIPAAPQRYITDTAGFISEATLQALDSELQAFAGATGHQLVVYIGSSSEPLTIEEWATQAFATWKIGRKGQDDGLLLVVMATGHQLRIEVGYGLESNVPDIVAGRIINDVMLPQIRAGQNDNALRAGIHALIDAAIGSASAQSSTARQQPPVRKRVTLTPGQMVIAGILGLLFLILLITNPSLALYLLFSLLSSGGRGGGGGGGGFSGGGGGSGGGGASGSW